MAILLFMPFVFIRNRGNQMAGGSLQLCEYPSQIVRLSCLKCGRTGQYPKRNLIARYGADIRLPDLRWEISQCRRHGQCTPPVRFVMWLQTINGSASLEDISGPICGPLSFYVPNCRKPDCPSDGNGDPDENAEPSTHAVRIRLAWIREWSAIAIAKITIAPTTMRKTTVLI